MKVLLRLYTHFGFWQMLWLRPEIMIVVDNTDDAVKYSEAIILLPNHLSLAHQWEGVVRNAGISIFAHNHC